MNRVFAMLLKTVLVASLFLAFGCKKDKDDDQPKNLLEGDYFTVENATYHGRKFPQATLETTLYDVKINETVLPGGSSYVSVNSEEEVIEFYVGVEGINAYYSVAPMANKNTSGTHSFILLLSQSLQQSFFIQIAAKTASGITQVFSQQLNYMEAGTGDLHVSLSFDNDKDIDLYVVQPDGIVIYYANGGGYDEDDESYTQIWGLDIDSNPDCSIDGINNENIFYPEGYVQAGKYEVWVNMYANCDHSIATNWAIVTTFQGSLIQPSWGVNPASGTFPINEPSNMIGDELTGATKVMEFIISEQNVKKTSKKPMPIPISESAKQKLETSKNLH